MDEVLAEVESEEIADRNFDAGLGIPIPIGPDHDFLQVIHALRGDREPDVSDHTGAGGIEDFLRGAGGNRPPVGVAASAIVARLFQRSVILAACVAREESILALST